MRHRYFEAWNTALLGRVMAARGQPQTGADLLADAVETLSDLGDDRSLLSVAGDLAVVVADERPLQAAQILAAARAIRDRLNLPCDAEERERYDSAEKAIESEVPADQLRSMRDRAARQSLEQLAAQAVSMVRPV
jgi:hypothetical protein